MGVDSQMSFGEFIEKKAAEAGITLEQKAEDFVTIICDVGEERRQRVWIRPIGYNFKDHAVIGVFSPALILKKGQQLGQQTANDLLKENGRLASGAWAIEEGKDEDYLIMRATLIADTMEPEELEAALAAVACNADEMEKRLGQDTF